MQLDQLGELHAAGRTPGTPERHDDRMTAQLGQLDAAPGDRGQVDFRRTRAGPHGLCTRDRRDERQRREDPAAPH